MSPAEVVAIDRDRDGEEITLVGEAIGESLRADKTHRWVNVLGDGVAIGVFMTEEQAALVSVFGDHHNEGDYVTVSGTVNVACDEHGGEFDVHATTVEVVREGRPTERPIAPWKALVTVIALLIAVAEVFVGRNLRERRLAS